LFYIKNSIFNLGYHESCGSVKAAIVREGEIKNYSRKKKIELIEKTNPEWKDLFDVFVAP